MPDHNLNAIAARARRACVYFDNKSSVDLNDLAQQLHVKHIDYSETIKDAATDRIRGGYAVYINPSQAPVRRHFSLAHELAHILVQPDLTGAERLMRGDSGEQRLESLCNKVAAALLMPARVVRHRLKVLGRSPSSVIRIAKEFDVSTEAMARKIVSIAPNPYAIIRATISERTGRLAIDWAYVSPRSIYGHRFIPPGKHVDSVPHFTRAKAYPAPWRLDGYIDLRVLGFGPRHRAITSSLNTKRDDGHAVMSVIDLNHQMPLSIGT